MGPGLDPDRAAEILVGGPGQDVDERGSGYRVTAGMVLTAAHVVGDAGTVRVRFRADRPGAWTAEGVVLWRDPGIDVAVVALPESGRPEGPVAPVRYGRVGERDGDLACSALGFPRHRLRADADAGTWYRDSSHVRGVASPWSNLRESTLSLRVPPPEHDPDPRVSPWQGMSGAAVWSEGRLIGIVRRHHRSDGLGELAAGRVDTWYERLDAARLAELALFLGLPPAGQLTEVGPAPGPEALREESLRALLTAERAAAAAPSYRLAGHPAPRADPVHVPQRLMREGGQGNGTGLAAERVPAALAVATHRHLLIEGVSGAGKSTFVRHLVTTLATARLTGRSPGEPVAVAVPAAHLTGDAPLPSLLRRSVRARLSVRLTRELPDDLFERAPGGDPWLLLIDGLDEIADPVDRERVVASIAADARGPESPYRWIVTTRPLRAEAREPLAEAGFGRFTLAPFDDDEVRALARGWLADPGGHPPSDVDERVPERVDERVDAFLRQVAENGLRQLVRTPLLATLTLDIHRRAERAEGAEGAGAPALPSGRAGLYREFIAHLLAGREGEAERRAAFRSAAVAVGLGAAAAEWLLDHRVALFQHLAAVAPVDDPALLAAAVDWTRRGVPGSSDFLVGWPELVAGLLTGSGLFTLDEESGAPTWRHRSFPEYLAARLAADELPHDWPGAAPGADALLRRALAGAGQEQAVLTVACWAERPGTSAERLLAFLADASDDFDPHALSRGGGIVMGDDSTRLDAHAALAGRLLAEGVAASAPLAERVVSRLLERARSRFTGDHFCRIIAAQPRRDRARSALGDMAHDERLPAAARADAVVTLGRVFGPRPLRAAVGPLLELAEPAQYNESGPRGNLSVGVSDVRALVAHKLSRLGGAARPEVNALLDRLVLPDGDAWARCLAAEAAVAVGEPDRALSFLTPHRPERGWLYAREVAVLLRAGARTRADGVVEEMFAAHASEGPWLTRDFEGQIVGVVESYRAAGHVATARAIADSAVAATGGRARAASLAALSLAGHPAPATEALTGFAEGTVEGSAEAGHGIAELDDWLALARSLWEQGLTDEVRAALDTLMRGRVTASPATALTLARLLRDAADGRHRELLRWLARHADPQIRREAAMDLVESDDRQTGVDALVELSRGELQDTAESLDVVRGLLAVDARQAGVELLLRLVERPPTDVWNARTEAFDLLCRVRPAEGRRALLELARARGLVGGERLGVARILLRLGERAAAAALAGDVVGGAAGGEDVEVGEVMAALDVLVAAGDAERAATASAAALRGAASAATGRGMTLRIKRQLLAAAELLVGGGADHAAERLLDEAAAHADGDDVDRRIADALRHLRERSGRYGGA
ncbi:serine protease [Streptomyces radicis]|uniref:NACHT domain-containing protein n=1 Tax=Streptomyces radicis TaxID=1750517 RepID=A0A3A9VUD3_9ACTN|nr:serine protease [Streptomyces radicis]RKN04615.1 NACHT domain-containing protein [Streptomyces radicis]RKN15573.1 NACHT domain-containing protein [Streptomyces radicis]